MPSLCCLFIWGRGAEVNCFNPEPRKVLTWHSVCMGRRFQNKDWVLLSYDRVCFGAFKYQHRLAKIAFFLANLIQCNPVTYIIMPVGGCKWLALWVSRQIINSSNLIKAKCYWSIYLIKLFKHKQNYQLLSLVNQ